MFKPNSIIIFCGDEYRALEANDLYGKVEDSNGVIINKFYWKFGDNECRLKE